MAVNLIDSNDIIINQTGNNIELNTSVDLTTLNNNVNQLQTQVDNLSTYSTTEQRIGTWIDGKPIYRKTLVYNYTTTGQHSENISSLEIDTITSYNWTCKVNNNYVVGPYDLSSNTAICNVFFERNNKLYANNGSSWTTAIFTINVEYTKTTD